MIVSNLLLLYFHDMIAFRMIFATGVLSYIMLVFSS